MSMRWSCWVMVRVCRGGVTVRSRWVLASGSPRLRRRRSPAPGSEDLAIATERVVLEGHKVAVWQFHGCLALGAGPADAFDRIDTANKAARVALQCRAAGHRVGGLGPSELAELERIFDLDS